MRKYNPTTLFMVARFQFKGHLLVDGYVFPWLSGIYFLLELLGNTEDVLKFGLCSLKWNQLKTCTIYTDDWWKYHSMGQLTWFTDLFSI